jgi:ABC-type glycerol-3-phosphate transport system substrate-binding protein
LALAATSRGALAQTTAPPATNQLPTGVTNNIDWRQAAGSTINVLMMTTQEAEAIKEVVPAFQGLTGITVNWAELEQNAQADKLNVEFRSGAGSIDACQVDFMLLPAWATAKYLEPLDSYLGNSKYTDPAWYDQGDFLKGIWDAGKWNGAQYLIPMSAESSILIYRKDLFDANGLQVPTTFTDLEAVAKALDNPPTIYGIGNRGLRGSGQNVYIWTTFLRGFGGDFFKSYPSDYTPTLDSDAAIQATQFYADLDKNYGPPGVANWSNLETYQGARDGVTALYVDATPHAPLVDDPVSSKTAGLWGNAVVPAGPAGAFPAIYSHTLAIPAGSKNKVAAWLWVMFSTSPPSEHVRSLKTGDPARASSFRTDEFKATLGRVGGGSYLTTAVDSMNAAMPDFRPRFPDWNQMGDRIGVAVQSVIAGEQDASTAMKSCQADVVQMLTSNGYL